MEDRQLLSTFTSPHRDVAVPDLHREAVIESKKKATSVPSITYYNAANTTDASELPISGWQGIRAGDTAGQYLITGTSGSSGVLYVGSISGSGTSYPVNYPDASQTSVYGVNNLGGGQLQLVGTYVNADSSTRYGFDFEGTITEGAVTGSYSTIQVPGATFTYVHSIMGDLAVGNYDGPTKRGLPVGPGNAFIYNVATGKFITDINFPGSISDTAYGIWYNGGTSYTIVGGFSNRAVNNMGNQDAPLGTAYMVDYNSAAGPRGHFSNWKAFKYPDGFNFLTHFQGISSPAPGVYTLSADSIQLGTRHLAQGSWVVVQRKPNGTFGNGTWVNLHYPGVAGWTSNDSVFGNQIVGFVLGKSTGGSGAMLSYQATVNAADG
jgi:hypothetical protein